MPIVRVQVIGMDQLIRDMRRMADRGKSALEAAAMAGAEYMAPKIRDAIPLGDEDSTHLKDKVKTVKVRRKNKLKGSANVEIGSNAKDYRYAFHLETGHRIGKSGSENRRKVPEKRFVRNTVDPNVRDTVDKMAEVFAESVVR